MEGFTSGAQAQGNLKFVYLNDFQFKMAATQAEIEKYLDLVKTRTKKTGDEVTELCTNSIVGHIVGVSRRQVPYKCDTGHEFNIEIRDTGGTTYRISLKDMGRQATYILTRLPNVDLEKPVRLGVFKSEMKIDGSSEPLTMAQLYIQQEQGAEGFKTVPNAFPKETADLHKMPEFENLGVVKGKTLWSNEKQWNWLMDNVALSAQVKINEIAQSRPTVSPATPHAAIQPTTAPETPKAAKASKPAEPAVTPETAVPLGAEYEGDDLPF